MKIHSKRVEKIRPNVTPVNSKTVEVLDRDPIWQIALDSCPADTPADVKLHSKRVEKIRNYTRNEWRR